MIEFKEGRWFIGIWFVAYDERDILFTIFTDEDPTKPCFWDLRYRFRHYDEADPGNDAWSGKDRKSFYGGRTETPMSEEEAKASVDTAIALMSKAIEPKYVSFVPLYSSDPKFCAELLMKQPWAHTKTATKEEYEEKFGEKGESK